jgi:hypothetical protein
VHLQRAVSDGHTVRLSERLKARKVKGGKDLEIVARELEAVANLRDMRQNLETIR